MSNFLKSYWALSFILAFIIITLFPPTNWYLSNSINSRDKKIYESQIGDKLPLRERGFIFSSPTRFEMFDKWGWSQKYQVSVKQEYPLQRSIVIHELILNYIIVFLFILLFYWLNEKLKVSKNGSD